MALTKVTGQVINDSTGLVVGVTTVGGGLSATDGFFSGIVTAVGNASFSGNVSVGGTLTYEDVTNIDAVGLITARNGVVVGSGITLSKDGDIFATGITTISENLKVGTGVTISPDGDGFFTGVVTATTFKGDGSQLSNVTSTTINNNANNRLITGSGTANTLEGESTLTYDGSVLGVNDPSFSTDAKILVKGNDTNNHDIITAYSNSATRGSFAIRNGTGIAPSFLVGTRGGSETLGLMSDGTERFRIGASGQFGIGGATYGTSGQVLSSQGSSSAPQWAVPGLIYEGSATSLPTDSGEVDVDVILSTAKRIEIFIFSYSVNSSNGEFILRLRTSGGTISSNVYKGSGHYLSDTSYATSEAHTSGFRTKGLGSASANYSGHFVLKNVNSNTWFCNGDFWNDNSATGYWVSGHVDAGATVTGVTLRNASGSFDAGTYKIIQYNTL